MQRYLWWACGVLLFCALIFSFFWYTQENIILRLPSSFFPSVITIEPNESIRFINLSFEPSWPASGPHPSHTTYPEFDTKDNLSFGQTWEFTFTQEGTYPFHDHNAPHMTGIVISGGNDISKVDDERTCTELPDLQQQSGCMEIYYRNISNTKSFIEARDIFEDITARYPGSCHTFAHDLGKSAYLAYKNKSLPDITNEGSSCGFGFWHGFTTAMQAEKGPGASKEFCSSLTGSTEALMYANRMNCYHGVGIGLIPDPPAPPQWGQFNALVEPALAFCDSVPTVGFYKERCLTGIFHAMTVYMMDESYGFTFDETSLNYCTALAYEYQSTCFVTLVAGVPELADFDLSKITEILQRSVPDHLFFDIFKHAVIIVVNADLPLDELGALVEECTAINDNLRPFCIEAVINKLYNNGTPGEEYKKAIAFCSSEWVYGPEKEACFRDVASYSINAYPTEKVLHVCTTIAESFDISLRECGGV